MALRLLKANLPSHLLNDLENCTILEFTLRQSLSEKAAAVLAERPRIFALSVSIWNHQATLELLQAMEPEWTGNAEKPVIVLGGPEITPLPPEADIFSFANFVIRGEGEFVFAELCQAILEDLDTAKRTYGKFIEGGEADLNKVKNAYDLYTEEDLNHKLIYLESSRGCPYNCAFCQSSANASVREFPIEPFLDDLGRLLQRCRGKTKTIKFLDRSFNVHLARAVKILEFCRLSIKNAEENSFQFHFEMVPSVFPAELREVLALFPPETIRLEIGIQSFNPKTNALIHRISKPEKELEVLRFFREKTNVILHVDLIAGLPDEDIESFGKGFDRLWVTLSGADNPAPFEIQLGILKCLPGTSVQCAEKDDFTLRYNMIAPYEVIETNCLPMSDMEKIKNFARFWEQIVNRRSFPEQLPQLITSGEPVFVRFMDISQKLLDRFGRNWGIPKMELEDELKKIINQG